VTFVPLAIVYLWLLLDASLNSWSGNAIINPGNYEVIKPNTLNHAVAFNVVVEILVIVPIAVPIIVGRWRYKRYRRNHSSSPPAPNDH